MSKAENRMTRPQRKANRLKSYDYSQNGVYFVTICTKERRPYLGKIVGGDAHIAPHMRLSPYGMIVESYMRSIPGIDIYVIMPNHIHMIIRKDGPMWASAPTTSLSDDVRSFKILVTKQSGLSLFQRSFHDHVIRNESDYRRIWEYIQTNPIKWQQDCFYTEEVEWQGTNLHSQ